MRFVASVMMMSGALLIVDAGATLLWQEPLSALLAQRKQAQLEDALASPPRRVLERRPLPGDAIGRIRIAAIHVDRYLVEGTDRDNLRKGPGHYPSTPLPGSRGTSAIAGHRTTYGAPFRHIDDLKRGERILIDMPSGRYVYRVERTKVVAPTDLSILHRVRYDRLVLSACHPLYSAAQRIVVLARFVRREAARVKRRS
jgi:sortase A